MANLTKSNPANYFNVQQQHLIYLADPGKARGCSTNIFAIHSFIHSANFPDPLGKIYLRRRHAQTVKNGASSHKTNYINFLKKKF